MNRQPKTTLVQNLGQLFKKNLTGVTHVCPSCESKHTEVK